MHVVMLVQLLDEADDVCGFIHEWVETLAGKVELLDVLTLRQGRTRLPENVRVHVLKPRGHEGKFTATRRFYQALIGIVRQSRVDVIFCHMTPIYTVVAAPIARLWKIPLITWYTHESVNLTLRLAERFSTKILTASQESFRLPSPKVIVTNHGINTQRFCPAEPDVQRPAEAPLTICSIGRISPRKDYETLIQAAHILVHQQSLLNLRFVIIGKEGTADQQQYFRQLQALVHKLDLDAQIQFAGSIPNRDVVSRYQHSDLFVNMRQTGGMDKAVLEAMACGVPTIVCNTTFAPFFGPLAEQLLFAERQPESLAERIRALAALAPAQRREIGHALRDIVVSEHDLNALMTRIVKIFATV